MSSKFCPPKMAEKKLVAAWPQMENGLMGNWLSDHDVPPEVRQRLDTLSAEQGAIDLALRKQPLPHERDGLLGRLDEIEHEAGEILRALRSQD